MMKGGQSNSEIFESIVDQYSASLYNYAFWVCQDRQTAEDVVQETFLKGFKNLHQLRDLTAAKSWIFTIFRREHARLFERQSAIIIPIEETAEQYLPSMTVDEESNHFVYNALSSVSREYSDPLILQVLGGFTTDEIAIILGISRSNVLTRLFRARKKLRKILNRETSSPAPIADVQTL